MVIQWLSARLATVRAVVAKWRRQILLRLYKAREALGNRARRSLSWISRFLATLVALIVSAALVTFSSQLIWESPDGGIHFASSGIIATALALLLSISIVPAQKAAEAFSTAILALYKSDRTLVLVFSALSGLAILSLVMGTGWTFGLSTRHAVAVQVVFLGAALDSLRAFYSRSLDLLVPAVALGLVNRRCANSIQSNTRKVERLSRLVSTDEQNAPKWLLHSRSPLKSDLGFWISQLEEFARKALSRNDIEAVRASIDVMGSIGRRYAISRQDSLVLEPDASNLLASPQSDASDVLNPIYESIKSIFDQSLREQRENAARACVQELGKIAESAMVITSDDGSVPTAPLAHAPLYYLGECIKQASTMPDALLDTVRSVGRVFSKIQPDVDTNIEEATIIEILGSVALGAYAQKSLVPAHEAAGMLLRCATHEIEKRGHQSGASLKPVLSNLATFVSFELALEKLGVNRNQTLPPYSITNDLKIRTLLDKLASQAVSDNERPWVNPFREFEDCAQEIVHHFRTLAKNSAGSVMLRYWILYSCMETAWAHVDVIRQHREQEPDHIKTIADRLIWFIHTPEFYFHTAEDFENVNMVHKIPEQLASLGIRLMELGEVEAAEACGKALSGIAKKAISLKPDNPFVAADVLTNLEVLKRCASVLNQTTLENVLSELKVLELETPEATAQLQAAMINREGLLDESLQSSATRRRENSSPVGVLHSLLNPKKVNRSTSTARKARPATSRAEQKVFGVFERKHFQPLSTRKIAALAGIPPQGLPDLLVGLGASRSVSLEGTELWILNKPE